MNININLKNALITFDIYISDTLSKTLSNIGNTNNMFTLFIKCISPLDIESTKAINVHIMWVAYLFILNLLYNNISSNVIMNKANMNLLNKPGYDSNAGKKYKKFSNPLVG